MVNLAIPAKVYKDVGIAFHPPFGAKTYVTLDPVAWKASFDPPSPPFGMPSILRLSVLLTSTTNQHF